MSSFDTSGKLIRRGVEEMSRHEGVSCDACLKSNFKGRRYKCLRCYDYDLCATCYEAGATTSRHTSDHPLQCILSRTDYELYYGGETSSEVNHALTCPICGILGFTESELLTHVSAEHQNSNIEVVCPICASVQGGEPNLVTEELASHLTLDHRQLTRGEDAGSTRQNLRRVQQPSSRTVGIGRARRPNMHFSSGGISPSGTGSRDAVDPIAELLSQLSGVRRSVPYDRLIHPRHPTTNNSSSGGGGSFQIHGHGPSGGSTGVGGGANVMAGPRRSVFPPPPSASQLPFPELSQAAGTLPHQSILTGHSSDSAGTTKGNEKNLFLLDKCLDSQRRKELIEDQSLLLQDLLLAAVSLGVSGISDGSPDDKEVP